MMGSTMTYYDGQRTAAPHMPWSSLLLCTLPHRPWSSLLLCTLPHMPWSSLLLCTLPHRPCALAPPAAASWTLHIPVPAPCAHLGLRVQRVEQVIQTKLQRRVGHDLHQGDAEAAVQPAGALVTHDPPRCVQHAAVHLQRGSTAGRAVGG
jgi:hypothetical protein